MANLSRGAHDDALGRIAQSHLATRGKELRLRLALEACVAMSVSTESAQVWAAACELLHNATLVHDDIQDRQPARRGRPAVWAEHGVAQAINTGDLLLMLPYAALARLPASPNICWYLSQAIAHRAEQAARGQALELDLLSNRGFAWADYERAAAGKTGALLALPVEGALLLSGIVPDAARSIADALLTVGTLFQMQDDLRDLYGAKIGRDAGSDLKEGRVSALSVAHWERAPEQRPWLLELLERPATEMTAEDTVEAAERFRDSGALLAVHQRMDDMRRVALSVDGLVGQPKLLRVVEQFVEHVMAVLTPRPLQSTEDES